MFLLLAAAFAQEPLKVAIIDGGLDLNDARFTQHLCPTGHKDFSGEGMIDLAGHGTHVASLIQTYAGNAHYCLIIIKAWGKSSRIDETMGPIVRYAVSTGASIINMSYAGDDSDFWERWQMSRASKVTFIVAAGNEGRDLDKVPSYPASYDLPNEQVVGALDEAGKRRGLSNYGGPVRYWEQGCAVAAIPSGEGLKCGTSMATAIHTGKVVHEVAR